MTTELTLSLSLYIRLFRQLVTVVAEKLMKIMKNVIFSNCWEWVIEKKTQWEEKEKEKENV